MSWDAPQRIAPEGQDEDALKRAFAGFLIRNPMRPGDAAALVFPGMANAGRALQAAEFWPLDPLVRAHLDAIRDGETEHNYLPGKDEVAHEILTKARNAKSVSEAVAAYKLYGEYQGHIVRPGDSSNPVHVVSRVMHVPIAASNEDWEERTERQQAALVANA